MDTTGPEPNKGTSASGTTVTGIKTAITPGPTTICVAIGMAGIGRKQFVMATMRSVRRRMQSITDIAGIIADTRR